ncbi:hypothetical protein EV1_019118 [Malus domestica]
MEVAPAVMTYMATGHELLKSASEVKDIKYLLELSSFGALSEAKVITVPCLGSFDKVDGGVEGTAERVLALLQVVTPKVPLAARMPLFFTLVAGTD